MYCTVPHPSQNVTVPLSLWTELENCKLWCPGATHRFVRMATFQKVQSCSLLGSKVSHVTSKRVGLLQRLANAKRTDLRAVTLAKCTFYDISMNFHNVQEPCKRKRTQELTKYPDWEERIQARQTAEGTGRRRRAQPAKYWRWTNVWGTCRAKECFRHIPKLL